MNKLLFSIIAVLILNPSLTYAFTVEGDGYSYDMFCSGEGRQPAIEAALLDANKKALDICETGYQVKGNYSLISLKPVLCKSWSAGFSAKVSIEVECVQNECKPGHCGDW